METASTIDGSQETVVNDSNTAQDSQQSSIESAIDTVQSSPQIETQSSEQSPLEIGENSDNGQSVDITPQKMTTTQTATRGENTVQSPPNQSPLKPTTDSVENGVVVANPPVMGGDTLSLQSLGNVWVSIYRDNTPVLEKILVKGEILDLTPYNGDILELGNAGLVQLFKSGKNSRTLGQYGEVKQNIVIGDGLKIYFD